jgi:hypothetical protein
VLQSWDFDAGADYVARRREALAVAVRTLVVLSPAALAAPHRVDEWSASTSTAPTAVTAFCSSGSRCVNCRSRWPPLRSSTLQAPTQTRRSFGCCTAYAERWVQTVWAECLEWTLVLGRRHLLRLLRGYVRHYNQQRPHRGLALAVPVAGHRKSPQGDPREVRRRDVLGGLIHEYHEAAAC